MKALELDRFEKKDVEKIGFENRCSQYNAVYFDNVDCLFI